MSYLDGLVVTVETSESGRVEVARDGREIHQEKIVFTPEGIRWIRDGHLCIKCLQDLRPLGAFPRECPTCHFPVRELQILKLERDYPGGKPERLGSRVALSDEMERLKTYKPKQGE